MKTKGSKEKLKPLSFYGLKPEDVIRTLIQIDPKELKRLEEEENRNKFTSSMEDCSDQQS